MIGIGIGISPGLNGAGGGVDVAPIYFFDGEQAMGRRMVVVGDSIASLHALAGAPTAITLDGSTTMTVTQASHALHTGSNIYGFRTTREELNGRFTVASVIDANTYTVTLPAAASGAVAAKSTFAMSYCDILSDRGSINWLSALNGACFDVVGVHAESGCAASYLPTLIANSAGIDYSWLTIICGINDVVADATAAATATYIIDAADGQIANGVQVIIRALGPWDSNNGAYSAARNQVAMQTNAILKAYCASTRGAYFMDSTAAGTTETSTTGAIIAGRITDGLHPAPVGVYYEAKQFTADYPTLLTSPLLYLPVSAMQDVTVSATSRQLWPNPLLAGTSGALQGSPVATGTAATSQIVYNTGAGSTVASLVADSDYGQAQRMVATTVANSGGCDLYTSTSVAALAPGEAIRSAAKVTVTQASGALKSVDLRVSGNFGAGTRILSAQLYPSNGTYPQLSGETLTFLTPPRLVSSITGLTSLRSLFAARASGADTLTVDVARVATWAE